MTFSFFIILTICCGCIWLVGSLWIVDMVLSSDCWPLLGWPMSEKWVGIAAIEIVVLGSDLDHAGIYAWPNQYYLMGCWTGFFLVLWFSSTLCGGICVEVNVNGLAGTNVYCKRRIVVNFNAYAVWCVTCNLVVRDEICVWYGLMFCRIGFVNWSLKLLFGLDGLCLILGSPDFLL